MERISQLAHHLSTNSCTEKNSSDFFGHVALAAPDPILGINDAYNNDQSPNKINLGVGAYRDNAGKPYVFQSVKKAEQEIFNNKALNKEYLPMDGLATFNKATQKLLFGNHPVTTENKIVSVQSLSGTGALRLGFEFLAKFTPAPVYLSNPSWGNHHRVIETVGLKWIEHPYWNEKTKGFDFEGACAALQQAPPKSIVLLHVCAHNPTGVDPTPNQWTALAKIFKERNLFPFFDSAYQGYASGDLEKDALPIKIFLDHGMQMLVAQSFAKNFGLYGERIGALHFVCATKETAVKVLSQIKLVVRYNYSNPPLHGARIVSTILNSPTLLEEWKQELKAVAGRIIDMRRLLVDELKKNGTPGNWDHITNQIGMFSYTGLNPKQCESIIKDHHVYLLKGSGRISMAGINTQNVAYLANAIKAVVTAQ